MSAKHRRSQLGPNGELYEPTIRPNPGFNPEKDAEALEKAMKGFGTDEDAITAIIGKRTGSERKEIAKQYKSLFGKDLIVQLKSELGGKFETLVLACMRSGTKHLAYCCYKAIAGAGTDEETLAQVLATCTNEEIAKIKESYQEVLKEHNCNPDKRNLEKDIENDCGGKFRNVLIALIQADRDEPTDEQMLESERAGVRVLINMEKATQQANELYNAGEGKLGTDESTFVRILVKSSVWQIAAIDIAYRQLTSNSLLDAIKNEMSGDLKEVLKLVVESALDRPACYAKLIHNSMAGLGTNDDMLIRLISSRADIDLGSIKTAYEAIYNTTIAKDVKGDTSGDYRKLLLTLLNEQ